MKRKRKRKVKQKPKTAEQKPDAAQQKPKPDKEVDKEILFNKKDYIICCGIFFAALLVYILTLAPTVYFGDSGELTAAAYNLGIAHPPGYPLYLLLGKLFMLLVPIGDMAMRLNLLSAFFASLVTVMIYLINRVLTHGRLISVLVSFTAAFSFTFWSQAVAAEVYTFAALFFCTLIFFTLLWLKTRKELWLLLLALTAGLALTHHVIIAVFYPVFFIFILLNQPRLIRNWTLIAKTACLFVLPLLLYLYLPIRSALNPLNDWGNPETFSTMMHHITAKQFGGLFLKHGFDGVLFQLNIFIDALLKQFPVILLILAVIGVIVGLKREKKIAFFFLALLAVNISYSLAYYITDIEPHFINIFLLLALFMGMVLDYLYKQIKKTKKIQVHWLGVGILIIIALLPLVFNWTKCDQSDNYLARNYGLNMLNTLEKNSVLFIDGEAELFITAYLKVVEGLRPDVEVYDVRQNIFLIPAMKTKDRKKVTVKDLYQFAQSMVTDKRPVYFTNPIFGNLRFAEYGVLYRVLPGGEAPDTVSDPWEKYDLSGLDRTYFDPNAKETLGKYFLARGKYLFKMNQRELSEDFVKKTLSAAGDRHPVLKQIIIFYMQAGKHDRAENLLKKAIKLDPFDSDNYNMLGMIAHYRLDYNEALINYDKVLKLRGNSISALMNRGILYEQMGDKEANPMVKKSYYQMAFHDLEQARKIEPANPAIVNIKNRISFKLSR